MNKPKTPQPQAREKSPDKPAPNPEGTNAVQHKPDPKAEPMPNGEHKYVRKSPYTAGND